MKYKNIINISNIDWAKLYKCSPELFKQSGTTIIKHDNFKGKKLVAIRFIGKHAMIRIDEDIEGEINKLVNAAPKGTIINLEHFLTFFKDLNLKVDSVTYAFLINKEDLNFESKVDKKYNLKKLTIKDKNKLVDLKKTCSEEEIDNAFVEIDHEIIWGIYDKDILVCAASTLDWGVFYDIGVITNSNYRRKGLAKYLVYNICKEIFKINKIPLYRCEVSLFSSIGVAKSLGFKSYFETYYKEIMIEFK